MKSIKILDLHNFTEPMFSLRWWVSWAMIFVGCTTMAAGYVFFISPYNIVPGGVYGASIVLHNIFPAVQVGTFGYMFDIPLLIISFKISSELKTTDNALGDMSSILPLFQALEFLLFI